MTASRQSAPVEIAGGPVGLKERTHLPVIVDPSDAAGAAALTGRTLSPAAASALAA